MPRVHVNGVDLDYVDEGTGIPVVFSHGGSSDLRYWEPQRRVIQLVRCIPDSRLVVIPGATHFMSYQMPTVFNDVVLAFLAGDTE